jgi:hypothetical protein
MRQAGWRIIVLSALLLFLFFADVPYSRFWSAFFDAGHAPLFGVIAIVVRGWLAGRSPSVSRARVSLAAFGITVGLGAATEVIQMLQSHGDPSTTDLLRDMAGAGAFLLGAWGAGHRGRARTVAALGALIVLLASGWTLSLTSARYVARDRAFPTLFALDGSWWEAAFIELNGNRLEPGRLPAPDPGGEGGRLARLDLQPGPYSGITFDEPYPDWRGRDRLTLTIVSDLDAPLPMAIRIHDAAHDRRYRDRFNQRLTISPGVNRIAIPIEQIQWAPDRRRMDLSRVRGVVLFAYDLQRPVHVFLGPLRME